jgi:chromosome condensin MukBEF MukE localization factor
MVRKNRGMVNFIAQTIRSFIIADSLFRIDSSVFVVGQKKETFLGLPSECFVLIVLIVFLY